MSLTYDLDIDWNGDGVLDGLNEADRVLRFAIDRGRSATIGAPGSGFQMPNVGKMIIDLDNHDGRYDAWNQDSPFYGLINPGRKIQFRVSSNTASDSNISLEVSIPVDYGFTITGASDFAESDQPTAIATARDTASLKTEDKLYVGITDFDLGPGLYFYRFYRCFARFDTSNIPSNATITEVTMSAYPYDYSTSHGGIFIVEQDWSASTDIDTLYDNCLASSSDGFQFFDSISVIKLYESTDLTTSWINKGGYSYYSFISGNDIDAQAPVVEDPVELAGTDYTPKAGDFYDYPLLMVLNIKYTVPRSILFTGFITDIRPSGYNNYAVMTCEDGAGWLNARTPDIALLESTDVGEAISNILDEVNYPFSTNIDDGIETMAYYWTSGANALTEINKLANSDFGRFCVDADGTAHFRNRQSAESISYSVTEDEIGNQINIPMPWDYARSLVKVNIYPYVLGTSDTTLWELQSEFVITAGDSQEIWASYKSDNKECIADDVYLSSFEPSTAFSSSDITLDAFSRTAKLIINNPTTDDETMTELIIKGTSITTPNPITIIEQTTDNNLPAEFVFDYPWLSNVNTGKTLAALLLNFLSEPKQYPDITVYNRPEVQLNADLEDRFRLILDTYDIDETYFINKISHWSGASTQELITRIWLTPMLQTNAVDAFRLSSTDYGVLDTNELGF